MNFLPSAPQLEQETEIPKNEDLPIEQHENIYDNPTEEIVKNKERFFPDPSNHTTLKRFFIGMSYPFEAARLCFTKYYAVVVLFDSILVSFVILLSLTLGILSGTFLITGTTDNPVI